MIFLLNIILFINLFFLKGNCQVSPSTSSKTGSTALSGESDPKNVIPKSKFQMRALKRRLSIKRKNSRRNSKGKKEHIDGIDDQNHLDYLEVDSNRHDGTVKQSIAEIDNKVKMRDVKGRTNIIRENSRRNSKGKKEFIDSINDQNHLNYRVVGRDIHDDTVKQPVAEINNKVKMRDVRGRSTIRRKHSNGPYKEKKQQINDNNEPNNLDYRVISGNIYIGNVKQSVDKFDEIVNKKSNGKSVEDLTKDFDHNDRSLSRSKSVYVRKSLGFRGSKSFFQRRHFLSHAATRIKRPPLNQYIPNINGFSIEPYLGSPQMYCISDYVWRDVWRGCGYKCFAADQFIQLKFRLIDELNRYREIHGVQPLIKHLGLYEKAQKHALRLAGLKSITRDRYDKKNGLVMGIAYYPAASIIMKKWYDEGYQYNYKLNYPRSGSQSFTQLIWKETTHVGIGVATRGFHIWIVLKLFPKGNINGKYIYNIKKPKPNKKCPE